MSKPFIYIASPYTRGDAALNTRYQMELWDQLVTDGIVLPYVPLLTHFQHIFFPRPYKDWIDYDLELIRRGTFDACLRMDAVYEDRGVSYREKFSKGADGEVALFMSLDLPVFVNDLKTMYEWAKLPEGPVRRCS